MPAVTGDCIANHYCTDQTAPVFTTPPANVTVECIGDVPAMTALGYTDNCDAAGSVTGTDSAPSGHVLL